MQSWASSIVVVAVAAAAAMSASALRLPSPPPLVFSSSSSTSSSMRWSTPPHHHDHHQHQHHTRHVALLQQLPAVHLEKVVQLAAVRNAPTMGAVAAGLDRWRHALLLGHLPEEEVGGGDDVWPGGALFTELSATFAQLLLPQLVVRHPELVTPVLTALLDVAREYAQRMADRELQKLASTGDGNGDEDGEGTGEWDYTAPRTETDADSGNENDSDNDDDAAFRQELAASLARQFKSAWAPPLGGLAALDDLYGSDHGLLSTAVPGGDQDAGGGADYGRGGFGLFDSVWQHTGWTQVRELQQQLKGLHELRALVRALGRRPTVDGRDKKKAPPQREAPDNRAALGVAKSVLAPVETTGTQKSDVLEGVLPSEMALLAAIGDDVSRRRRRRLFLAKKADKQLASYSNTGWVELRSLPRRKPWRYYEKRPTSFGGPVIICLDTSWSMAGPRENLAKAVVLEASVMAARDGRSCYVLAFSGERNVAEYDGSVSVGVRNKAALVALLDFLACGFRGGTDVTGPLTRAIELMEDRGNVEWGAADLLLVTDGELQTPPVRPDLMDKLGRMEVEAGLEIHGLLVGRNHSVPLQMLCTDWDGEDRVHNFLFKYDPINILRQQQQQQREEKSFYSAPATVLSGGGGGRAVSSSRLYYHGHGRRPGAHDRWRRGHTRLAMCAAGAGTSAVDDMYRVARQQAADKVNSARGRHDASPEPAAASDDVRGVIRAARAALEAGLIERETEVQILLLAVLCREHVLLLGPPGTGKSELGRRLASISGGDAVFFERLLTKYTLPEELFGALSLSALEQDLYVRNTAGYLPTASVAFLDEVFKASSSILNSLLTILNERRFDNGNQRLKVPLLAVVAASNELPDSEELDALYDRFLFRREVKPVSDGALADLLALPAAASAPAHAPTVVAPALLTEELTAAIEQQAAQVTLSADAMHLLRDVRAFLRDEADPPVYISDRRLVKAAHMLRIAAATQGRAQVSTLHCLLLQHVLWHSLEDQQRLRDFLWKHAVPDAGVSGLEFIIGSLQQRIVVSCEQHEQPPSPPLTDTSQLQGVLDELTTYSTILAAKAADLSQLAADAAAAPTTQLWLSTADRAAVRQQLAPRAEAQAAAVTALLEAVEALRAAATDTARPWGDRATVLEQVWETYHAGTGRAVRYESGEFYDDGSSDDLIFDFTMSKKEAAKKLSPEQLKLWKKGAKALQSKKKKSSSEEDAFDDDE